MKVYVERVVEETYGERVPIPTLSGGTHYVPGQSGVQVTAVLHAVVESVEDVEAWKNSVGKTLKLVSK